MTLSLTRTRLRLRTPLVDHNPHYGYPTTLVSLLYYQRRPAAQRLSSMVAPCGASLPIHRAGYRRCGSQRSELRFEPVVELGGSRVSVLVDVRLAEEHAFGGCLQGCVVHLARLTAGTNNVDPILKVVYSDQLRDRDLVCREADRQQPGSRARVRYRVSGGFRRRLQSYTWRKTRLASHRATIHCH